MRKSKNHRLLKTAAAFGILLAISAGSHSTQTNQDRTSAARHVRQTAQTVETPPPFEQIALLATNEQTSTAFVRGILPETKGKEKTEILNLRSRIKTGRLDDLKPGLFRIILSRDLAQKLKVKREDFLTVLIPRRQKDANGAGNTGIAPHSQRFQVSGIIADTGKKGDEPLALIHLQDAQTLSDEKVTRPLSSTGA